MEVPATPQDRGTAGHRSDLVAHGLLTIVAILWGSSFVGVRLAVETIPPMLLGLMRAVLATALLFGYAAASGAPLRVSRRDFGLLALLGVLGISYYYVGINLGIALTSASTAGLLSLPFPAMAAVGAWLFLGETIGRRRALGIGVALGGATFLTLTAASGGGAGTLIGNLLVLSTTLDWTAYTLLGRRWLARWPATVATAYIMLTGALALIPAAAVEAALTGPPRFTARGIGVTVYLAVACTGLAYIMWNRGLERLGATRTSVYLYLQPVVVILLAIPLLGERLSWQAVLGGIVVVLGTVLVARK